MSRRASYSRREHEVHERIRRPPGPEVMPLLAPGQRVRHRTHPELTGYVKHYEYHESGKLSPIPYCIGWDDSHAAAQALGWFFVYAGDESVEAMP